MEEKYELISIIMPAYNAAKFIRESVESVFRQTYQNWELIIIDDGSTDNTKEMIEPFLNADTRIQYLWQENGKQGKARNSGIKISKGSLIAFLDADDLWMPEKLERQISVLRQQDADLVFTDVVVIDNKGDVLNETCSVENNVYLGVDGLCYFFKINQVPMLSVLTKREAILRVGCFKEEPDIQNIEDYDLWIRMLLDQAKLISISEKLGAYRRHDSQTLKGKHSMLKILKMLYELELKNTFLVKAKKSAVKLWIVRCLKQDVDRTELKQIISIYPNFLGRKLFQSMYLFVHMGILKKIIYYSSKENLVNSALIYFKSKRSKLG